MVFIIDVELYAQILTGISAIELLIGLSKSNVHILKDALVTLLLCGALYISSEMMRKAKTSKPDKTMTFGYGRVTLLSAMGNCIYLFCMGLFEFLEAIHHMIEHLQIKEHQAHSPA